MKMLTVREAQHKILEQVEALSSEVLPLEALGGRVLAADLVAEVHRPAWDTSAMDGYAVRSADIVSPGTALTIGPHIAAGDGEEYHLKPGTAARIFTGSVLPDGADTVILQEDTERDGSRVVVNEVPRHGQHIRFRGEDISPGQIVLSAGRVLSPGDLSCLASLGYTEASVYRRPSVQLMTTGRELLRPGEGPIRRGQIIDGNTGALAYAVRTLGAVATVLPVVPDDRAETLAAVQSALTADVLITTGGVSVGEHDHVRDAIDAACPQGLSFWKVAVKPGKPLVFAQTPNGFIFGLPGNPVSALVTFELFVRPALLKLSGHRHCLRAIDTATLVNSLPAGGRREEYLRATCWREGGETLVDTRRSQSSGALSSIAGADALVIVPPGTPARAAGERVDIIRLNTDGVGSHVPWKA